MADFTLVDHPLVRHKLAKLRDKDTPPALFRQVTRELGPLLLYEATRDLELADAEVETPLEKMRHGVFDSGSLAIIAILRAGAGLVDGMLDLAPSAPVGHIGLYRDHETLSPVQYYVRVPEGLDRRLIIVADPMLATGNTACAAVDLLKKAGAKRIKLVCLVAAPEGAKHFADTHPDVPVYAAALDRQLDERGYILPGLGDAGDRLYGTAADAPLPPMKRI